MKISLDHPWSKNHPTVGLLLVGCAVLEDGGKVTYLVGFGLLTLLITVD